MFVEKRKITNMLVTCS